MLLLAAAAISTAMPQSARRASGGAAVQAVATIRIISGARLSFRGPNDPGLPRARNCILNSPGGQQERARLIEFE